MNNPSFGVLPRLAGYQLRRAQARFFDDFRQSMADVRITPGQFGMLTLIAENEGLSQTALARALGLERSTMAAAIDKLEARGWARRKPAANDQRANELALTPEGRRLLKKLAPRISEHESRMLARLSKEEQKTLLRLLEKIWREE